MSRAPGGRQHSLLTDHSTDTLRGRFVLTALVVALGVLLWPVVKYAIEVWSGDEQLRFAFLVPPVLAALVWWRRDSLVGLPRPGKGTTRLGLVILGLAVIGYAVAERLDARSPMAIMAGVVLWSVIVSLWGWPHARALAFPVALLTLTLSLQQSLIAPIAFWLQNVTADSASALSHVIGLPIDQEGLVLRGQRFAFIVADTCSGMNSLLPLLTLAGLLLYVVRVTPLGGLGVLASVLPLVILANTVRVECVLLVASGFGQDAAMGFFHGASSLVLFGLALLGLLLVSKVARCQISATA